MQTERSFLFFAGTSHPTLAKEIAACLGMPQGKMQIETFPDGEIGVHILENVRGREVFVLQTIARQPNSYLMELLIIVDALKRASAHSIVAVIPYFGYARQDRKGKERAPISAKLVADILQKAGVTSVLTMDLHTEQIQGFFDIPVDNLSAKHVLGDAAKKLGLNQAVIVSPDLGGVKLGRAYAEHLKLDLAIVDKRRVAPERVEVNALIGDVKGKDVLLTDDICATGITLKTAASVCQKAGAKRAFAAVTHALIVGRGFEESAIEKMLVSNTIPLAAGADSSKLEAVSVAPLFGKAIEAIASGKSISSLL